MDDYCLRGKEIRRAFLNVKLAPAGVGATPADLVRHNIYVVGHTPDPVPVIFGAALLPADG